MLSLVFSKFALGKEKIKNSITERDSSLAAVSFRSQSIRVSAKKISNLPAPVVLFSRRSERPFRLEKTAKYVLVGCLRVWASTPANEWYRIMVRGFGLARGVRSGVRDRRRGSFCESSRGSGENNYRETYRCGIILAGCALPRYSFGILMGTYGVPRMPNMAALLFNGFLMGRSPDTLAHADNASPARTRRYPYPCLPTRWNRFPRANLRGHCAHPTPHNTWRHRCNTNPRRIQWSYTQHCTYGAASREIKEDENR